MSAEAIARLAARVVGDYLNGGHVEVFVPDLNDTATLATYTATNATSAAAAASAAAATYALVLALIGGGQGVGTEQLDVPPVWALGSGAFSDVEVIRGIFPNLQNAAYQILALDQGRLTYCTSGTNTYTLPLAADLPDGWCAPLRNRSGNNLTVARTGSDTINGTTSATIATGNTTSWVFKTGSTSFEVG